MVGRSIVCGLVGVAAIVLFTTGPASAQLEQGRFYAGPMAGVAFPFGDLGDIATPGLQLGGTADYMVTPMIGIGPDLYVNIFGGEEVEPGVDWTYRFLQIGGHGRYFFTPEKTTIPFLQAGLGIYNAHVKVESEGFEASESESKLGFNGGGGVIFDAGNMLVNVSGIIHIVTTEGSSSTYLNASVGVLFPFGG